MKANHESGFVRDVWRVAGLLGQLFTAATAISACASQAQPSSGQGSTGGDTATNPSDASVPSGAIVADSCSQGDVQSAVDGAQTGSVVVIPAGICTWGDQGSAVAIDRAITVQGMGRTRTIIEISKSAGSWTSGTIQLNAAATVKSLTIRTPATGNSGTAFSASADGFRISDVEFIGRTQSVNGYFLYTGAFGLVDSCTVSGGAGSNELIFARGPTNSWQSPSSMGTADNLFIEDCVFSGEGYVCDCNSNARCVVRFNTITSAMKIDGHGKASNDPPRGVRQMEVYYNNWTDSGQYHTDIELRGGTGRVFFNSAAIDGQWLILHEYAATAAWPNFGNTIQTVYPIDDQIGVGIDPKSGGSEPMLLWGNRAGKDPWPISLGYGDAAVLSTFIRADRDYFAEAAPFDGTTGIGIGTRAQMNALTPTHDGVGFWVTDESDWNATTSGKDGALYVWVGGAWKQTYVPYAYPHPRRSQ